MALTKDDAYAIAKKFGVKVNDRSKHRRVRIYCGKHFVGTYGITRGSGEKSFDYIPKQIKMTMAQAKDFIESSLTVEKFCNDLREQGAIPSTKTSTSPSLIPSHQPRIRDRLPWHRPEQCPHPVGRIDLTIPLVQPVRKLVYVPSQVLHADLMERARQPTLQDGPDALNAIRMGPSFDVLILSDSGPHACSHAETRSGRRHGRPCRGYSRVPP